MAVDNLTFSSGNRHLAVTSRQKVDAWNMFRDDLEL
jgi:hypothetical protein